MSLLEQFHDHIRKEHLFTPADNLLLAVSGGVDSTVLVELCKQSGFSFSIAHCNFRLRGPESDRDESFVRSMAEKYAVPFFVRSFDTEAYAATNKLSIQEAARQLRYNWFDELIISGAASAKYLLTAHHADDNAETVAMHFFRGTGLHGLTGIPARSGHIRRPLLEFTKEELLVFSRENNLAFTEDASNASSKYTRNYFRNEVLPAISKVYPQVMQNLQGNIHRFRQVEALYRMTTDQLIKKLCKQKGGETHVPIRQLLGYKNHALVYELIAPFGFSGEQVEEVVKLAAGESGSYIQSPKGDHRIIKHRHWFIIAPVADAGTDHQVIDQPGKIIFPGGTISIENSSSTEPGKGNHMACLDAKDLRFPLLLRKWKAGDYFYPLGMKKKKKKLARFLIDQKLSKTEKEQTWVIESQNRILWVVNHRIDERFKITANTKQVVKFVFTKD